MDTRHCAQGRMDSVSSTRLIVLMEVDQDERDESECEEISPVQEVEISTESNTAAEAAPEMIELEHQAKVTSQILFYVLNDQTRNVASMIEVSQYAGSNRRLIVVLNPYPGPNHTINGEQLTKV